MPTPLRQTRQRLEDRCRAPWPTRAECLGHAFWVLRTDKAARGQVGAAIEAACQDPARWLESVTQILDLLQAALSRTRDRWRRLELQGPYISLCSLQEGLEQGWLRPKSGPTCTAGEG